MLSGMSVSLGVTSPSSCSGLGDDVVACGCSGKGGASTGWTEPPDFLPYSVDVHFISDAVEGEKLFSPSTKNELVPVAGASSFPGVDVWLVPRLDSVGEVDLIFYLFFEADGVTHSLFDDILMECGVHEYRCRIVDANVNRILPREVAQAVMVPTRPVSRNGVRDVGKELPRVGPDLSVPF